MATKTQTFFKVLLLMSIMLFGVSLHADSKDFIVVIDAGHGGHDPGAIGRKAKEKNINLNVALKLGKLIQKNCKDVKVIYTRTKDVFVTLNRRAEIANNAKADLFISVHTNSLARNHTAVGASTWTLGLAKSDANLEVAKRENSVILYEDDYKTSYAGFDPNSAESYIIFEFMQDNYMSQSVHFASLIQSQFKSNSKRQNRGVHQAGFLVLKASAMPSVLIELGFISTPAEEQFLSSEAGANSMANSIYKAFVAYKDEQQAKKNVQSATGNSPSVRDNSAQVEEIPEAQPAVPDDDEILSASAPVFMIQFLTSSRKLASNDKRLSGLEKVDYYLDGKTYKYTCYSNTDYNKVRSAFQNVRKKFKDAFIIAFKDGSRTDVNEAIKEFKKNK